MGFFSAKSAYLQLARASFNPKKELWRDLWKLRIHERLKFFLWRVGEEGMPTAMKLANISANNDSLCRACHRDEETINHVFLNCDIARCFWLAVGKGRRWDRSFSSGEDLLQQLLISNKDWNKTGGRLNEDIIRNTIILEAIWKWRNDKVFNWVTRLDEELMHRTEVRINEFCNIPHNNSRNSRIKI